MDASRKFWRITERFDLVFRRHLDVIDDEDFDWPFLRLKLQAQLFLQRRKDRGTGVSWSSAPTETCVRLVFGGPLENKVVSAINSSLIDDYAPDHLCQFLGQDMYTVRRLDCDVSVSELTVVPFD